MLVENRRISLLLFVFFQLAPSIAMEEKREKRLSRGSKLGDEREATRKGVMVVVVVVSLEAATKGSGNYGEAANSREAEAKAAVGSQADLRRGFAPRFILRGLFASVDARRRRPEFPPADPIQSHVVLVSLSLSPSICYPSPLSTNR